MKLLRKLGATSQILQVFIRDSSSTTGAGLPGLAFGTSGLTAYYHRDTDTTATAISLVTMTTGTFTSSGFKEVDSTNMPGVYQFCPPNAALASGASSVVFLLKGATNMAPLPIEIDLDGQVDVTSWLGTAVTAATAGIPDVNAKDINNVPTTSVTTIGAFLGNATAALAVDASGRIDVGKILGTASAGAAGYVGLDWGHINAPTTTVNLSGTTIATVTNQLTAAAIATGIWQDTTSGDFTVASSIGKSLYTAGVVPGGNGGLFIAGTNAATTITTSLTTTFTGNLTGNVGGNVTGSVGSVATGGLTRASFAADTGMQSIRSNTAQAGGSTTLTLDASASAVDNFYNNCLCYITGGTGVGQSRFVTGYVGSTKVATVNSSWKTTPDNTSTFAIMEFDAIPGATAPTAAQVATAVWQDATPGDFTAANSVGKSLYNAFTSNTSVFTTASLVNAPTGGSAPTVSQIATAVWQDTTAGDFTTAGSIGKSLFTSGNAPGAVSGLALVGSNMGTVTGITGITFPTNFSALGISVGGHISNVDTLTTYTGNTPQTGDSFARIGATGSGLTSLAPSSTALSTTQWTNSLATNLGTLAGHDPGSTLASASGVTAVPTAVWANATRTLSAFAFTVSSNVTEINGTTVTGDGSVTPWGPA